MCMKLLKCDEIYSKKKRKKKVMSPYTSCAFVSCISSLGRGLTSFSIRCIDMVERLDQSSCYHFLAPALSHSANILKLIRNYKGIMYILFKLNLL